MFPQHASERHCSGGCLPRHSEAKAGFSRTRPAAASGPWLLILETQASALPVRSQRSVVRVKAQRAFTLLELLVVIGIIAVLLVLLAPAFTTIKSAGDITSAAYTIKGVLDTARTYAKANNTYTWVGFYEEDVSTTTPGTAGVGRLVMSIVASKDGTMIYSSGTPGTI